MKCVKTKKKKSLTSVRVADKVKHSFLRDRRCWREPRGKQIIESTVSVNATSFIYDVGSRKGGDREERRPRPSPRHPVEKTGGWISRRSFTASSFHLMRNVFAPIHRKDTNSKRSPCPNDSGPGEGSLYEFSFPSPSCRTSRRSSSRVQLVDLSATKKRTSTGISSFHTYQKEIIGFPLR